MCKRNKYLGNSSPGQLFSLPRSRYLSISGDRSRKLALVSLHLKGCPPGEWHIGHEQRVYLLRQVISALKQHPAPIVLAGDFNLRPGPWLDRLSDLLKDEVCCRELSLAFHCQ